MMYTSWFLFVFAIIYLGHVCFANTVCQGTITGQVNGNLLVKSDCTLSSVMVNGIINVDSGANLEIEGPSTINGGINLNNAGGLFINSGVGKVTINGNVIDQGGSQSIILCDAVITGNFKSTGRNGAVIVAGESGCSASTIFGQIEVSGGSGFVQFDGLQNSVSTITLKNRFFVILQDNARTSAVHISECGFIILRRLEISGTLKIERNQPSGGGVSLTIDDLTVLGSLVVRDNANVIRVMSISSSGNAEFSGNTGGIEVDTGSFNNLSCSNNSEPLVFNGITTTSASGQCAGL